jgi:hypothetical protein
VEVANIGDASGSFPVKVAIDRNVVETRTVLLGPGQTTTLPFAHTSSVEGVHTVSVGGTEATFAVGALRSPAFREGPLVRLRPLEDIVSCDQDGLVEAFFRNPSSNDVAMIADMSVSVPSNIFMYSTEGGMSGTAGTASAAFTVQPGQAVGPFNLTFKSRKIGRYFVVFSGRYWPEGNKDLFQPITLTAPLEVREPSCELQPIAATGGAAEGSDQAKQGQTTEQLNGGIPVWMIVSIVAVLVLVALIIAIVLLGVRPGGGVGTTEVHIDRQ